MPCEGCQTQFNVFRRKRSCSDCKRFYCNNCLTLVKRGALCDRCAIFAKRPLLRSDLAQLKPKDLIFYLQSKHISTAGCVEKDELVGLILLHAQQHQTPEGGCSPGNGSGGRGGGGFNTRSSGADAHEPNNINNTFDSLKQTCQNFFTNITDNLSDSFASFDGNKPHPNATNAAGGGSRFGGNRTNIHSSSSSNTGSAASMGGASGRGSDQHISHQPRVSTRQLPTYASRIRSESAVPASSRIITTTASSPQPPPSCSSPASPSNNSSQNRQNQRQNDTEVTATTISRAGSSLANCSSSGTPLNAEAYKYDDCECSDEELYATFASDRSQAHQDEQGGAATTNSITSSNNISRRQCDGVEMEEESSHSSFEELGALGGTPTTVTTTTTATTTTSEDGKAITDSSGGSGGSAEQWQLLDVQQMNETGRMGESTNDDDGDDDEDDDDDEEVATTTTTAASGGTPATRNDFTMTMSLAPNQNGSIKKMSRRRSDSYINRRRNRPFSDDDSPVNPQQPPSSPLQTLNETNRNVGNTSAPGNGGVGGVSGRNAACIRCGKNKMNIRRHVERMRRHLESSQMSEEEVRSELREFLVFLEKRAMSMDCSDTETAVSSGSGAARATPSMISASSRDGGERDIVQSTNLSVALSPSSPPPLQPLDGASPALPPSLPSASYFDENEGIHVYAVPSGYIDPHEAESRFINLDDYESLEELEELTVKQLKEVLMVNRVDYKGCCEKQELLDRVQRLWKNRKSMPSVEKLPTDELCKICMDAPIECIILECGHMATCTRCGKVLSECPICRQYIVRVVRFFRA